MLATSRVKLGLTKGCKGSHLSGLATLDAAVENCRGDSGVSLREFRRVDGHSRAAIVCEQDRCGKGVAVTQQGTGITPHVAARRQRRRGVYSDCCVNGLKAVGPRERLWGRQAKNDEKVWSRDDAKGRTGLGDCPLRQCRLQAACSDKVRVQLGGVGGQGMVRKNAAVRRVCDAQHHVQLGDVPWLQAPFHPYRLAEAVECAHK